MDGRFAFSAGSILTAAFVFATASWPFELRWMVGTPLMLGIIGLGLWGMLVQLQLLAKAYDAETERLNSPPPLPSGERQHGQPAKNQDAHSSPTAP